MADDIDIEEHDVLENPLIRKIFPDLTILKKEIIDYNNYDHEPSSQSSNANERSSTVAAAPGAVEQDQNESSSGLTNNRSINQIILGSKHSSGKPSSGKQNPNIGIKKAKVCLQNITQFLNNDNKFCKICLILFPKQESLTRHTLLEHKEAGDHCKVNKNKKNTESKKTRRINYECQKCSVTFSNLGNLNRHERNFHAHNKYKHITEVNVMVKINDYNIKTLPESDLKECFHCDLLFSTQQLLIDHLYEVLNSKKSQIAPNQTCPKENQEIDNTSEQTESMNIEQEESTENKDMNVANVYACPVCSYCFNTWDCYEAHMTKKHGVYKVKRTSKVSFKPTCKFCDMHYTTFKSYNLHLHKNHKDKILQKVKIKNHTRKLPTPIESGTLIVRRKQRVEQGILLESNETNIDNTLEQQESNEKKTNCIKNDVKVMALKTILFKCTQCHVYFLTTESAESHRDHSALEDSKCINCHKYFKEKDMNLHLEQHKYSNYFSVIDISGKKIITNIKGKDTVGGTLYKCPLCAVHFDKEHISSHRLTCAMEPSGSTYCKVCDILIADNINTSHGEAHDLNDPKPSDFKVVELKKKNKRPIKRKKDTGLKMYEEMYLFNLSYCNVCDCNVARAHYKSTIHVQSRCSHFIKYVCQYCGLVFSNKSINTHRKLHQKFSNLTLKDFTFYDLRDGKKILPPIPVFPKCNSCEKHFITKFEIKRHVCYDNNHLTCPVCGVKLSQSAYKLHVPFHDLAIDDGYKETERPSIPENVNLDVNIAALSNQLEPRGKLIAIFTCKNCLVSFNSYDEAIEHCHLHTNLDTINSDAVECSTCKLSYDAPCREVHQQLHRDFPEGSFKFIEFDVFNFGGPNDEWLKHVFGAMPPDVVDGVLEHAMYKSETRVKMRLLQSGSSGTTAYKCEKCQCFIASDAIYRHYKCCNKYQKDVCKVCNAPINSSSNDEHEKCNASSKSFKIIEFNRKQDIDVNFKIANMRKCYVLYECRSCNAVVDKKYDNHTCAVGTFRECSICGLLLNEMDHVAHIAKHKRLTSFNGYYMKVILLGTKPNINNSFGKYSDILSKFSGVVCDYTFYKCSNCEVCVRDQRNTSQHYCLIDAAKSKCPKCDLVFDEGKLKGHLKLHETDPEFVKEAILVKTFSTNNLIKKLNTGENTAEGQDAVTAVLAVDGSTTVDVKDNNLNGTANNVKVYKCVCGLHYLTEQTIKAHLKKCNGKLKTKQSKQNCSKCYLTFSPDVLFKHLIEHHGNKDVLFQYEIINLNPEAALISK